ncbi:MAG: hypothetical protein H5U14_14620 [Roseovarius sp.]|nr:hypothetical protein [Roseovarius sp.]
MRHRIILATILALPPLLSGCGIAVIEAALCEGTASATTAHAAALAADGGPRSLDTGALLIRQLDAGCGR